MSENDFTKLPQPRRAQSKKKQTKKKLSPPKPKKLGKIDQDIEEWKKKRAEQAEKNKEIAASTKELVKEQPILWEPLINPETGRSPQREFLESIEDVVLMSGTRGSAKSSALLIDPLRYCQNRNFRALIVRKTMPELEELISRAKRLYYDAFPGVSWRQQEKKFVFPSGARIEFGYCDTKDDVERYRGQEYTWLGVDELTMFPDEGIFDALCSSVRTTDPALKAYVRCTTNPYGAGFVWVKTRFIDASPEGQTLRTTVKTPVGDIVRTQKWIHSTWRDNPLIKAEYIAYLATLPDHQRPAWYEGSWEGGLGMAFPDFRRTTHVIKPFEIPANWSRFRACDWGYASMAVCLWVAVDPENVLYVYRELKTTLVTPDVFAIRIGELERNEKIRYGVIDGAIFNRQGAPTVDELMRQGNPNIRWQYADKSPNSRKAGKALIHQYLAVDRHLEKPRLQIFDTCSELIQELGSLPIDEKDPEDVDTDARDHAYDALRYAVLSRPSSAATSWLEEYQSPPIMVDADFGY